MWGSGIELHAQKLASSMTRKATIVIPPPQPSKESGFYARLFACLWSGSVLPNALTESEHAFGGFGVVKAHAGARSE